MTMLQILARTLLAFALLLPTLAQAGTYDLVVERAVMQIVPGRTDNVIAINGSFSF